VHFKATSFPSFFEVYHHEKIPHLKGLWATLLLGVFKDIVLQERAEEYSQCCLLGAIAVSLATC